MLVIIRKLKCHKLIGSTFNFDVKRKNCGLLLPSQVLLLQLFQVLIISFRCLKLLKKAFVNDMKLKYGKTFAVQPPQHKS